MAIATVCSRYIPDYFAPLPVTTGRVQAHMCTVFHVVAGVQCVVQCLSVWHCVHRLAYVIRG